MYISVEYSINAQYDIGCSTVSDLYVLETSETDQNFTSHANWLWDNLTLSAFVAPIGSSYLATPGVYVAFRDQGTCVSVTEVVVYYPICDNNFLTAGATFPRRKLFLKHGC